MQEFGHKCWVLQQDKKNKKLDPRSQPFNFVGLDDSTKGYCYWNGWQNLTSCNVICLKDDHKILDYEEFKVTINQTMEIEGEKSQSDNLPSDNNPEENNDENISTNNTTITETLKASKIPIPAWEKSTQVAKKSPFHYRFLNNPMGKGPREWW